MKKLTVFILGLLLALVVAEICLRIFIGVYLSLSAPGSSKDQLGRLDMVFESCALEKYVKFDEVCGFIPKAGFFRGPQETIHSKRKLYPYSDYFNCSKEKKEDVRVICIGDSTTYGPSYYDSYPYILEGLLKNAFPDKNVRVLNAGLSASSSRQLKRVFQFYLVEYKPDIVIWRKGAELTDSYGVPVSSFNNIRYKLWRCVYSWMLFRVLCIMSDMNKHLPIHTTSDKVNSFIKERLTLDSFLNPRSQINLFVDTRSKFNSDFQVVKQIAFEHGIKYVLAVDYLLYKGGAIESDCNNFQNKNLQPVVCTKDSFQISLASRPNTKLFLDSCHLTRSGCFIIAQNIFNFLIQEKWINRIQSESKRVNIK